MMITLPQLRHLSNVKGFITPYISPLTIIPGRTIDQHALLLASLHGKYLWLLFSGVFFKKKMVSQDSLALHYGY